jgi:hypothetical protein
VSAYPSHKTGKVSPSLIPTTIIKSREINMDLEQSIQLETQIELDKQQDIYESKGD